MTKKCSCMNPGMEFHHFNPNLQCDFHGANGDNVFLMGSYLKEGIDLYIFKGVE